MHARSTTYQGAPGNLEAGVAFVKNEAWPVLEGSSGCRGLSMLVDRETGQCILTSSWESEAAMLASDEDIRPVRDRGRDILGGSVRVDEWEIALMYRTHHGECCRVSWLQGDPDAMVKTMRVNILPGLQQTSEFCSASVLVNRSSGLGCATTAWETRGAMQASRAAGFDKRSRAAIDAGVQVVGVREFELAYAHLHVPQMA